MEHSANNAVSRLHKVYSDTDEDRYKINSFVAWLTAHKYSFINSVKAFFLKFISSMLTCLVIAVALSFPVGLEHLVSSFADFKDVVNKAAQISVYLDRSIDQSRIPAILSMINSMPNIHKVMLINPEQALMEFEKSSGLGQTLQALPHNPLPTVIILEPDKLDRDVIFNLQHKIQKLEGVSDVKLDLLWVERLIEILSIGKLFVQSLAVLFFVMLLLVVANTIKLHVDSRKSELMVIKLIGATNSYIRRPFLYLGVLYGIVGAIIAWCLLYVGFEKLNMHVTTLASLYDSNFSLKEIGATECIYLVLFGGWLCYLISWWTVGFYVRKM